MALHQASGGREKLIFAPSPFTPAGTPAPAGQFEKHETDGGLRRADLDPESPIRQFHAWFADARRAGFAHPESCTFATASLPSGRVSARVVYLKELDAEGFVVYSNFGTSQKAKDLEGNPWAALTFWYESLERQIRVEGRAIRLPAAESQVYFDTRIRGSRIGAWASRQSQVLQPDPADPADPADPNADDGRKQLVRWYAEAEKRFGADADTPIPVPDFWGGLRIVPERVEFWQGRHNRLHDRFVYDRQDADGKVSWTLNRLSP